MFAMKKWHKSNVIMKVMKQDLSWCTNIETLCTNIETLYDL